MLVGDSIGAQWFSALPLIFREPEWRVIALTKSACAMVDIDYFYPRIGKIYSVCTEWRDDAIRELEQIQPEVAFVGSAATYGFSELDWVEGSARLFERLSLSADRVVVIPGTPSLGFDGPGCIARGADERKDTDPRACFAEGRMDAPRAVATHLQAAASRFGNVEILDLNDLVCPDNVCSALSIDGTPVFRDSQHLTDTFVRHQSVEIGKRLGYRTSSIIDPATK